MFFKEKPYLDLELTVKRAASILLLGILAFNWVGYRLVSGILEHRADIALNKKIDRSQYHNESLIELRVPLNAPYLAENNTEYERYDGEVEIDGVHYKYVKRKIEDGQLVLLCLPNEHKKRFQNSRVDFFKLVNDLDTSKQSKDKNNTSSSKAFTAEYKQENNLWSIRPFATTLLFHARIASAKSCAGYGTVPEQPPCA